MPELPEVETIVRGLRPLHGQGRILGLPYVAPHLLAGLPPERQKRLVGLEIRDIQRRGKLVIMALPEAECLVIHLRMTGRLGSVHLDQLPKMQADQNSGRQPMQQPDQRLGPHTHLLLDTMDRHQATRRLFFQDQRKFGTCRHFIASELATWPFYASLGPEPLELTVNDFAALLKGRKSAIKAVLLNQRIIAGIGNIYADESLYRAGIHPAASAASLSQNRLKKLGLALQDVLREAIAAGGSSIRDYRTASGLIGTFQESFNVYGRKHQSCPGCGHPLQTARVAGRTSCFCARCQRGG
jgi:formamidopyrimidine-DNA glycosylase